MQSSSAVRSSSEAAAGVGGREQITIYHWLVLLLGAGGWLFDCMGQRIFVLAREPALKELLGAAASEADVRRWGGMATCLLMLGWAIGGIVFGLMSDKYGRVKAMVATLLAYTVFSGLSGFARNGFEFLFWRFLFGLGVGGMFGSATTLVAESVPQRVRTMALGAMQSLSALGTMLASVVSLKIPPGEENCWGHFTGWQVLSFVGVLPALLAVPIVLILKAPESWKRAKAAAAAGAGKAVGSVSDLARHSRWRHNLLVGVCLGVAGMVGLWGIAFFSPELITTAFKNRPLRAQEILRPEELVASLNSATNPAAAWIAGKLSPEVRAELTRGGNDGTIGAGRLAALVADLNRLIRGDNLYEASAFASVPLLKRTQNLAVRAEHGTPAEIMTLNRQLIEQTFPGVIRPLQETIDEIRGRGTMLQDMGAVLGMFVFTFAAGRLGRRTAFLGSFVLCLGVVAFVFHALKTELDVYWMLPLMGFATLAPFAGYSIYFPEIFPTRLRGTGVGFCYNTVRCVAAPFPFLMPWLGGMLGFRSVAMGMSAIYVLGIVALIWAPETKGIALPEE
jgi:MFS family permease